MKQDHWDVCIVPSFKFFTDKVDAKFDSWTGLTIWLTVDDMK